MGVAIAFLAFFQADGEIPQLIAALGSESIERREEAGRRLTELGARTWKAVFDARTSADPEIAGRAETVWRAFPPAVRLEEYHAEGLARETVAALPGLPDLLGSPSGAARVGALELLTGLDIRDGNAAHRTTRVVRSEDLTAITRVWAREGIETDQWTALTAVMRALRTPALAPWATRLLCHPDAAMRQRAIRALAASGVLEAVPILAELLGDRECGNDAMEALFELKLAPPADVLAEHLVSPDPATRLRAVSCVGQFRIAPLVPAVASLLRYPDASLRLHARTALELMVPAWKDLAPLLASPQAATRADALHLLRCWNYPRRFEAAFSLLGDPDADVRAGAVELVVQSPDPAVRRRLLEQPSAGAIAALGRLGIREGAGRALDALHHPDPAFRRAALQTVRALDLHEAADDVLARIDDEVAAVRLEASRVAPHLAGDRAGPRLRDRLRLEGIEEVQIRLIESIAEAGFREAGSAILPFFDSHDPRVVDAVIRAAGELQLVEAVPRLSLIARAGSRGFLDAQARRSLLMIGRENPVDLLKWFLVQRPGELDWEARKRREDFLLGLDEDMAGATEAVVLLLLDPVPLRNIVEAVLRLHVESAAPQLIQELADPLKPGLGPDSGRVLVMFGRREAIDPALTWLSSHFWNAQRSGIDVLVGFRANDKIPDLVALLDGPNVDAQTNAWNILTLLDRSKTVPIFRERLVSGPPMSRAWAATFLAWAGDASSAEAIEPLLDEREPWVRREAALALGRLRSARSFDVLLAHLRHAARVDIEPLLFGTIRTAGPRAGRLALPFLRDPAKTFLAAVLYDLEECGPSEPEVAAAVASHLDDPDYAEKAWKVYARMDPPGAVRWIERSMERAGTRDSDTLIARVADLGPAAGAPIAARLFHDSKPAVRGKAVRLLASWGAKEHVESVAEALHDESGGVREDAVHGLAELGDARAILPLLELSRKPALSARPLARPLAQLSWLTDADGLARLRQASWSPPDCLQPSLLQCLEELARNAGLTLDISGKIPPDRLRRRAQNPHDAWRLDFVLAEPGWSRTAALVVESSTLRVLDWDEARGFWEDWARRN